MQPKDVSIFMALVKSLQVTLGAFLQVIAARALVLKAGQG